MLFIVPQFGKKSEIENKRKEEKMERERENRPGELLWGAYLVFSGELKMEEERKEKKKKTLEE